MMRDRMPHFTKLAAYSKFLRVRLGQLPEVRQQAALRSSLHQNLVPAFYEGCPSRDAGDMWLVSTSG